jgi:hypothetical protein
LLHVPIMVDNTEQRRAKVPIREFLADFRSSLDDRELREKYNLSARGFVSLIKALLAQNLISPSDLSKRKEVAVKRDLAKESQFLAGLFICPQCSHPSPHAFDQCPACGTELHTRVGGAIPGTVTSSGNHVLVEESPSDLTQETEILPEADVEEEAPEETAGKPSAQAGDRKREGHEKPSAMDSIRSLFSKLKKK